MSNKFLKQAIKDKARQLGFILAGVTSCDAPAHLHIFEDWLARGHHGTMDYLASDRNRSRRTDPKRILPECESILVLALPYTSNAEVRIMNDEFKIAAYALGDDYHDVIPPRLKEMVEFIEAQIGHPVPNRWYTDSGPVLERELAQRAGLGWIGKNSMLIHPKHGSTFLLAEILLGIQLEPDEPFPTDHCGTCTRCLDACPTHCILPNRTIDARRCISYLTIENKGSIPEDLREQVGTWVFGCDVCQQVCPWNRFSHESDAGLKPNIPLPVLSNDLLISPAEFNQRFKRSPIKRAKRRGYLRNLAVAVGNNGKSEDISFLEQARVDEEPLVKEHAEWALKKYP